MIHCIITWIYELIVLVICGHLTFICRNVFDLYAFLCYRKDIESFTACNSLLNVKVLIDFCECP